MRLIDADKINPSDVIGGNNDFASDIRKAMQDLIDSQPTAYDVDKVIEQLEEYKGEAEQLGALGLVVDIIETMKVGGVNKVH
jgi:hypothetical protein